MKKRFVLLFLLFAVCCSGSAQTGKRFFNRVFNYVDITPGLMFSYGTPVGSDNEEEFLYFDFYEPWNDTMAKRPLVITVFGGAFVAGNRQYVDMVSIGDTLAHYGYAVASIDYRLLPILNITSANFIRAAYMAAQDVSAAIRFFKGNAEKYRIDTNRIFLLGNSAGTIASYYAIYNDEDERPLETYADEGNVLGLGAHSDLGGIHTAGNPDYWKYSASVAGFVAQWGCVMDTLMITADENTPICLIHGNADKTVPYDSGVPYGERFLGITNLILPTVYGSYYIDSRLSSLGVEHEFHTFEGEPHCFYLDKNNDLLVDKLEDCLQIAIPFLAKYAAKSPTSVTEQVRPDFSVSPNPVSNYLRVDFPEEAKDYSYSLYDMTGRRILTGENEKKIDVAMLKNGVYVLEIEYDGMKMSKKFVKY